MKRIFAVAMLVLCCSCADKAVYSAATGVRADFIPYLTGNGLYGYADRQGRLIIPAEFAEAEPFVNNRAAARPKNSEEWGLIDGQGQWLVKPQFNFLSNYPQEPMGVIYREGLSIPLPGGGGSFIRLYPKELQIVPSKTTRFAVLPDNTVVEKSKQEAPDPEAVQELPAEVVASAREHQVTIVRWVHEDTRQVKDIYVYTPSGEDGMKRMGFMSKTGELLTEAEYTVHLSAWGIRENVAACIERNGKFGFFGYNGKMLYEPQFDKVYNKLDFFYIEKKNLYAIMDKTGTLRTDFIFSAIKRQVDSTNLFHVTMPDGRDTLWDLDEGRLWAGGIDCADAQAISAIGSDDGRVLLAVRKHLGTQPPSGGNRDIVFTNQGKNLGMYRDSKSRGSRERLWLANMEGKWGALDLDGNPAIPFIYDSASPAVELPSGQSSPDLDDVVLVQRDGKIFYVDGNGREYRETRYDQI